MPKNKALCILTGASRGIGNAILEKLCGNGYNVIAISRSNLTAVSLGKPQRNEQIFHVPFDLRKVEKFQDLETVSAVSPTPTSSQEGDLLQVPRYSGSNLPTTLLRGSKKSREISRHQHQY